eukprot:1422303-Amphidinium_carterae.1
MATVCAVNYRGSHDPHLNNPPFASPLLDKMENTKTSRWRLLRLYAALAVSQGVSAYEFPSCAPFCSVPVDAV